MPEKRTLARARADKKAGKAASTQAGEFIKEQIEHIREGKHGARSTKQAIAIGLSEARRAGVELTPPGKGKATAKTRAKARRDLARGHGAPRKSAATAKRSRASENALKRESRAAASPAALSRHARAAAAKRSPAQRAMRRRKKPFKRANPTPAGGVRPCGSRHSRARRIPACRLRNSNPCRPGVGSSKDLRTFPSC